MKNLKLFTLYILFLSAFQFTSAQAPQGMNYQAVARNSSGAILPNQNIGIRITITDGNGGSVLYEETHNTATNQFGLFTLNIGNGTAVTGTFSGIAWASVTPWMLVEMDPTGGISYVSMGSSQLLSVPYALSVAKVGQSSSSVFGTGILNIDTNTKSVTLIPGMTQTITVPSGYSLYAYTFGGVQTQSAANTGYSIVDIVLTIDGNLPANGGYQRLILANSTGITKMIQNWSIGQTLLLNPGTHTIAVKSLCVKGSPATVSSDNTGVLQGLLTLTLLKN